jgi:SDR family mycofactocin-dependent oxidoreductase
VSRVAVVTGAARGIGAAVVRRLVAEGWSVVAVDVCADDPALPYPLGSREQLDALSSLGEVTTRAVDVRDAPALAGAVALAESAYGGLDAAFAVAGVIAGGVPHWKTSAAAEAAVLDVDLRGVLNLARVAVPALLRRPAPRTGRLVAVASAASVSGLPALAAYCAAKAGVAGFVRGLAADLRGTGITANAVAPGSTDTAMLAESARLYGMSSPAEFATQQPVERVLTPDEVAAAAVWLAGESAGGITGVLLPVDGGLTL